MTVKRLLLPWVLVCGHFLAFPSPASTGTWSLLPNSPIAAAGQRHDDLTFINESDGWLVNGNGDIYSTTDGGTTWNHLLNTGVYNRSVAFTDSLHGVVGYLFRKQGTPLSVTSDSGETWTLITPPNPVPQGICGLWAASGQIVYGVGAYYGSPTLIKTMDNGTSWTTRDMSPWCGALVDCCFWHPDSGIAVGSTAPGPTRKPLILMTTDGGDSWTVRWMGTRTLELCWKISFVSRETGFVSLENLTGSGASHFLSTKDGGLTWQENLFHTSYYDCQGIGFVDEQTGWLGGWNFKTEATEDGGLNWTMDGPGNNVNRFRFPGPNIGYACGDRVYKWNGGVSGVVRIPEPARPRLLEQNTPNPFRRNTRIGFRVEQAGPVTIRLFNLLGKEVRCAYLGTKQPGRYEEILDAGGLPAGLYLYQLTTARGTESRKMWVMPE